MSTISVSIRVFCIMFGYIADYVYMGFRVNVRPCTSHHLSCELCICGERSHSRCLLIKRP